MRLLVHSICKCCGLFEDSPKASKEPRETFHKEEISTTTIKTIIDTNNESPFRVKEMRQRSVDYVVHSPRFGGSNLPDCTGGTGRSPKLEFFKKK